MLRFLSLMLCLLMALACQQNTATVDSVPNTTPAQTPAAAQPEAEKNWQLNTSEGLNIHHPEDWEVDLSGKNGSKFLLYLPKQKEEQFREQLMLTAENIPQGLTKLEAIGKTCAGQITKLSPKTKVTMQRWVSDSGYYELAYIGPKGNMDLMNYQRIFKAKDKIYRLTYSGDEADFSNKLHLVSQTMDTFDFPR